MAFCTVADVERFLMVDIPEAKQASATRAINAATAAIQNYCGQVLELIEDEEITLDCTGAKKIFLPELPVVSVAEVIEDGETLTADEDYKLGQHGILHRLSNDVAIPWAAGVQILEITYTHGYETMPTDVVDICTRAASRAYQAGLKSEELDGVPGVTAKSLGDYSVSFGSEQGGGAGGESVLGASASPVLLRSEKEILNRYRYMPA